MKRILFFVGVALLSALSSGAFAQAPLFGPLQIQNNLSEIFLNGGQAAARANLGAAASGANSDITSLTGLTTPLALSEGGTGSTTPAGALAALGLGSVVGPLIPGSAVSGYAGTSTSPGTIAMSGAPRGIVMTTGYFSDSPLGATATSFGILWTFNSNTDLVPTADGSSWFNQIFFADTGNQVFTRDSINGGAWTAWRQLAATSDVASQISALKLGSLSTQNAGAVAITGGTLDGTTIGSTTPAAANFTALSANGGLTLAGGISATGAAPGAYDFGLTGNPANAALQVSGSMAAVAASSTGSSIVLAADSAYYNNGSSPTYSGVYLKYFGTAVTGNSGGQAAAKQGQLMFQNVASANIATNSGGLFISPQQSSHFVFTPTGDLGIGTLTPSYPLDVVGTVHFTGGIVSDGRILVSGGESHFSAGSFADPDPGVSRDAKFGSNGIAVLGGTKTDTLTVTGASLLEGNLSLSHAIFLSYNSPQLNLANTGDTSLGASLEDTYNTLYVGGNAGANSQLSAPFFAINLKTGELGSVNQTTSQQAPTFRNVLDDGSGNESISGTASISGATTTGSLAVTGSATVGGALTVTSLIGAPFLRLTNGLNGNVWNKQGADIGWNYQSGQGETDFINSRGGGGGGFHFYNTTSSSTATPSLIDSFSPTGLITAAGGVTSSGPLTENGNAAISGTLSVGGILTAPTAAAGTNSTQVATTAFVSAAFNPSGLSYTAAGTGAQPQTVQQKLQQVVNAADFMTPAQRADILTGNPTIDEGAAINAALASLQPNGEGTVMVPCGVIGDSTPIVLNTGQYIKGCGPSATIIRALASSTSAVIETANFASLVNTSGTTGAPYKFGIFDLTVDGNNVNRTGTEDDIDIYGFNYTIFNTEEIDAPGNGIFSQFGSSTSPPAYQTSAGFLTGAQGDSGQLESLIMRSKQYGNDGDGILYEGPTDATITHDNPWNNSQYGLYIQDGAKYSAGGTHLMDVHTYYNGNWGFGIFASNVYVSDLEAESSGRTSGGGVEVGGDGVIIGSNVNVWNNANGPGISFNNTGTPSDIAALNAHGNGTDGIQAFAPVVLSGVTTYGNGQNGLISNSSATQSAISSISAYGNGTNGIYWAANSSTLSAIEAEANKGNGVEVSPGVSGVRLDGQIQANLGTQFASDTTDGNNTFNFNLYYQSGQGGYTGTFEPTDRVELDVGGPNSAIQISSSTQFLGSKMLSTSSVAPSISSGFGTSPSITSANGTAAFEFQVGSSPGSSGVIAMPPASTGWVCDAIDLSANNGGQYYVKETAENQTSVTLTMMNSSGSPANFGAGDYVVVKCTAY